MPTRTGVRHRMIRPSAWLHALADRRWPIGPALGVLLLGLLSACATPQSCALVPLATMPLQADHNLLLVPARIKGHEVRLLVDTGAERTLLTEAAVKRLGLGRDGHHTRSTGVGGSTTSWDASVPGIELGDTVFPITHVAVGDFRISHLFPEAVDGLLGADILLGFELDIDIPDHRLTIYRLRRCAGAVPPWPAVEVPGVGARRDRMLVPFSVNGTPGMALLDTGSQASAVSREMALRIGITPAQLAADPQISVHGASPTPVDVPLQRFRSFRVGPDQLNNVRLAVLPNIGGLGDGLVGADFIRGRRLWLAFPTHKLFLERHTAAK